MRLRSMLKPTPKKKRTNLSAILNSEYFFHRSIQIQMALNQDRLLPMDYLIKKAKPKINTGKKKKIDENKNKEEIDSSFEANKEKEKKEIPDELEKILDENQKKFAIQNKKYHNLKEHNDIISGYWHYINRKTKKEEREILFKRYFSKNDKNTINLYSEHLQKFCLNIFKSNPLLMRKKNAEMFFHYLSEFNKYYKDENKFLYVKQKIVLFLEKLRDYLEFVKIKADTSLDSISKDIKIKNSKFVKEMELKVKQELKNLKEKNLIKIEKDMKESQKIIDKTKETLDALFKDKTIFEDPAFFDPDYNKIFILKSRNVEYKFKNNYNYHNQSIPNINVSKDNYNYSPNKTQKMNSTISTGFYQPDRIKNKNKSNNDIKIDKNNEEEILIHNTKPNDTVKFQKIKIKKPMKRAVSTVFNFGKKKNLIDMLTNKPSQIQNINKINIEKIKIENEKNSGRESISSSIYNDNEKNKMDKIIQLKNNLSNNNYNIASYRKSEEENIAKILSNKSSSKMINMNKKSRTSSISIIKDISKDKDKEKDISRESKNFRKKSIIGTDKETIKINKYKSDFMVKNDKAILKNFVSLRRNQSFNYNLGKDPVVILYEDIKDKQKIKQKDVDNIKLYLNKSGKNFRKNLKSMDIIRQAKKITDRMDIERKTKKVFQPHLTYEQLKRLDDVKEINKKLNKLDVEYLNRIFDYKSKSSDSLQLYNK